MTYADLEVELKARIQRAMREIRCLFQIILRTISDLRQAAEFVCTFLSAFFSPRASSPVGWSFSGGHPLNFPIKLNNRLASLQRSVENGDARPTDGAYKVFQGLSGELEVHLEALKHALSVDLRDLNSRLEHRKFKPIK